MLEGIRRRFFVVIHTITNGASHVISEAVLAKEAGADGVFLIPDYARGSKKATVQDQFHYLEKLKSNIPSFPIGVNFLAGPRSFVPKIYTIKPDLFQTDSISLDGIEKAKLAATEFFVALAFKYSRFVHLVGDPLREHCENISSIADVPTTSGDATGVGAKIDKVREIRSYLPEDKRLGIASGVSEKNVQSFLKEGVTDFLVATSLIDDSSLGEAFDFLDYAKVRTMAEIIHA